MHSRIVSGVAVLLATMLAHAAWGQAQEERPDAAALVKKIQQAYGSARGYHFEHTVVFEKISEGSEPVKLVEVTFVTASEKSKEPPRTFKGSEPDDSWNDMRKSAQMPFNFHRFHFALHHPRGELALASDGKTSWMYVGQTKEYKKGNSPIKVLGPTASTMYAALHLTPLAKYVNDSIASPRFVGEEEIAVGNEKKVCYVVQAIEQAPPFKPPEGAEPPALAKIESNFRPQAGVSGVLMLFQIHGLGEPKDGTYFRVREKQPPPEMKLWIDRKEPIVWRCQIAEKMQAASLKVDNGDSQAPPVLVRVTDTFTVAKISVPLPDETFQFMPPEGAKEVEEFTKAEPPSKD